MALLAPAGALRLSLGFPCQESVCQFGWRAVVKARLDSDGVEQSRETVVVVVVVSMSSLL